MKNARFFKNVGVSFVGAELCGGHSMVLVIGERIPSYRRESMDLLQEQQHLSSTTSTHAVVETLGVQGYLFLGSTGIIHQSLQKSCLYKIHEPADCYTVLHMDEDVQTEIKMHNTHKKLRPEGYFAGTVRTVNDEKLPSGCLFFMLDGRNSFYDERTRLLALFNVRDHANKSDANKNSIGADNFVHKVQADRDFPKTVVEWSSFMKNETDPFGVSFAHVANTYFNDTYFEPEGPLTSLPSGEREVLITFFTWSIGSIESASMDCSYIYEL